MNGNDTAAAGELGEIVDRKIASLVGELVDADWQTEEVVLAIDAVIRTRWLKDIEALRKARAATPDDFVSDGNEG
jgi:hypothetical protein